MKKFKLFLATVAVLLAAGIASAQNVTVTGVIKDAATGEAIPFASVQVLGTMNGVAADADGAYSISAAQNAILVFSSIGYVTVEQEVAGKSKIDVALDPDSESLDDVVVVAYGTAKKSSFTGSATAVKSETLQKRTVANVSKAIEGLVAGVTVTAGSGQPGSGASIQIRGTGSVNASSTPLYVVDGIPFDGALASLNPNDIESLTVLKDAAACALYGTRGANGVILITTKKGADGKATVNFRANFGVQSRSLQSYDMVNQQEFVELTWEALKNEAYFNGGYSDAAARAYASSALSGAVGGEHYNPYKNYTWETVIDQETGKLRSDAVSAWNENWMDELTEKKAFHQDYSVSVAGGNDKTKYNFSLGYTDDKGVLITTGFKRYSARAGVDHQITDWLAAGVNTSYAYTYQNESQYSSSQTGNAWYTAQFMAPIYPVYLKDENGKDALDEFGNKQYDYGLNGRPKATKFNVVGDLQENKFETIADNASVRTYAILGGDKDVMGALKGLSFTVNFGADIRNSNQTSYYNPDHGDGASVGGEVDKYSYRYMSYTFNQILKYDRKFGQHHILAQGAHESYSYNYKYLYAERTGVYKGIYELAPATNVTGNNSYSSDLRKESYFARLNYDFADKYYFEATWRTDGSSRFNKDYRWGQFWSVGASWRFSEENFMKNASWIDNGTFRVSYGQLGNDELGSYYAWQSFYDLTWANASNPGAMVSSLANPSVSWEKKGTLNVGLEALLFNRFLNVTLEGYYGKTTDLLLSAPMPMSTGFTGYNDNIGSLQNVGFESTFKFNWKQTGAFRASSTLMAYLNRNKILALTDDDTITSGVYVIKVGMPIYTYYTSKYAGVDPSNGKALYWAYKKDDNGDKIEGSDYITSSTTEASNSKYYLGSREPKLQGSFNSDFTWGPVDFSFLTTFSIGGKVYDSVYSSTMEVTYAGDTWSKHALRRWQNPGDVTDVPAIMIGSTNLSQCDRWLVDASYFAIKSIQLGYTLPEKWTRKIGIKSLRIFANGDNLFMFSKLHGSNLQYNFTGGNTWSYTPTRIVSAGIDINF